MIAMAEKIMNLIDTNLSSTKRNESIGEFLNEIKTSLYSLVKKIEQLELNFVRSSFDADNDDDDDDDDSATLFAHQSTNGLFTTQQVDRLSSKEIDYFIDLLYRKAIEDVNNMDFHSLESPTPPPSSASPPPQQQPNYHHHRNLTSSPLSPISNQRIDIKCDENSDQVSVFDSSNRTKMIDDQMEMSKIFTKRSKRKAAIRASTKLQKLNDSIQSRDSINSSVRKMKTKKTPKKSGRTSRGRSKARISLKNSIDSSNELISNSNENQNPQQQQQQQQQHKAPLQKRLSRIFRNNRLFGSATNSDHHHQPEQNGENISSISKRSEEIKNHIRNNDPIGMATNRVLVPDNAESIDGGQEKIKLISPQFRNEILYVQSITISTII
ncbi:hypothetical protein SSS_06576 [Sarcoptes scabiei]|uniref:Uncharacterized protein n=1 Tax=Sarcoptes scabiei TaxID=52283 RepID=A0A834RBV3_SARSC|nr:hypothetical protein SSS_06576 [Sarcoptes scabiei]